MRDSWLGWSLADDGGLLWREVFDTRQETIKYACWNVGGVEPRPTASLQPWFYLPRDEASKAWRRLKRSRGLRVVRVLVSKAGGEVSGG